MPRYPTKSGTFGEAKSARIELYNENDEKKMGEREQLGISTPGFVFAHDSHEALHAP